MKIVHIDPFFYPFFGGTENYVYELSKYLISKGHDVSVITSQYNDLKRYEVKDGIKIHRVPSAVFWKLPPLLPPPYSHPYCFTYTGYKLLKKINPDIIHIHSRYFPGFFPVILHKKLLHKPLFITVHNSRPESNNMINMQTNLFANLYDSIVGNLMFYSADFILGNSQYSLDATVPKGYPEKRTAVAYNGIYTGEWVKKKTALRNKFECDYLVLADARLVPQKGLEYLIRACAELQENTFLYIRGRGPLKKELDNLMKKLKVKGEIVDRWLTPDELHEIYSAADVFVCPSLHEPFGIMIIQAMSMMLPIVTTPVGGIPEVVGGTALIAEPRSAHSLATQMKKYFNDPQLMKKNGAAARERAVKRFDWRVVGKQCLDAYEKYFKEFGK